MLEFAEPPLTIQLDEYMELARLWKGCSPCVGFCISLGSKFFNEGYKDVKIFTDQISPEAQDGISPRVLPAYAMVYWFARQVHVCVLFGCVTFPILYNNI